MKAIILAPGLENYLAINSLNETKAEVIVFIVNDTTVDLLPDILKGLTYKPTEHKKFFVKNVDSSGETIREFLNAFYWLTEVKGIQSITVDATNTLKTVGSAVYFAASLIEVFKDWIDENADIRSIFTTCEWEVIKKDGAVSGKPVEGTEKIIELEHPMNAVGFALGVVGCNFFNEGLFRRSAQLFDILKKNTTDSQHLLYGGLSQLSASYDLWDKFRLKEASSELKRARDTLHTARHFDLATQLAPRIDAHIEILANILRGDNLQKITDILANGDRRLKEGRFDDAIGRFYRSLEMIGRHALRSHNIDVTQLDFSKLPTDAVESYKRELGGSLPQKHEKGTGGIALKDSFVLLAHLQDPLGTMYRDIEPKFLGLLQVRNQSILAHGTTPVTKESAQRFRDELVVPFAKMLFKAEDRTFVEHAYPRLSVRIKDLLRDTPSS